jgi:hypothetical protein
LPWFAMQGTWDESDHMLRRRWMKSLLVVFASMTIVFGAWAAPPNASPSASSEAVAFQALPKAGEKVVLDGNTYFVFSFTQPPKLGTAIMRVEVFHRDGQRDTTYIVKGDVDMPSMRGAHTMGDKPFALSAKGQYLLPVPLVMPGDWEFRFTFEKSGKTVFRGAYLFDL